MAKKAYQKTPKYILGIDWETSGATWGGDSSIDYQGISFGAVLVNTGDFSVEKTLYRELQFDAAKYKWTAEAEAIHGLSREYLAAVGVSREEAAVDLATFIVESHGPSPKVMVLGHNVEFDISFTNQLLNVIDIKLDWHHVKLDTASAGFITMGLFKSDMLFDALALPARTQHNALEDILMTVDACARMKLLVQTALGA